MVFIPLRCAAFRLHGFRNNYSKSRLLPAACPTDYAD
jgi:hypothetical protein